MGIAIDSIGFAQSGKYVRNLKCLKLGVFLTAGGLLLAAVGTHGLLHSSTWFISSTNEQREGIMSIFKHYDDICKG